MYEYSIATLSALLAPTSALQFGCKSLSGAIRCKSVSARTWSPPSMLDVSPESHLAQLAWRKRGAQYDDSKKHIFALLGRSFISAPYVTAIALPPPRVTDNTLRPLGPVSTGPQSATNRQLDDHLAPSGNKKWIFGARIWARELRGNVLSPVPTGRFCDRLHKNRAKAIFVVRFINKNFSQPAPVLLAIRLFSAESKGL